MTQQKNDAERVYSRRKVMSFGAAFGALFVGNRFLAACADDDGSGTTATDAGTTAEDATTAADSAVATTCDAGVTSADASVAWATGGTASMTGKASYPNPFACGTSATTCTVSCELTEGPCYSSQSVEIQDISYGYGGLPTRVYFQVLDEGCTPVPNATIDVWHVTAAGKYSGNDAVNENIAFCTGNDPDYTSKLYFRGKQTTNASGVAFFDTCFPGWYASRTVHIHLTITVGGVAYVTTQLNFDDTLVDSIIADQPLYDTRGARDTKNTTDTVFSASDYQTYEFETAKMADGAMLAWKTLILRKSTTEAICGGSSTAGGMGDGGMGPGGDGGMPPGDGGMPPGDGGAPPPM